MAKKKYKKKPEVYYAVQYSGTNVEEMTGFCPLCVYDSATQELLFTGMLVRPTDWLMSDNANQFTMLGAEQFNAFFALDTGPA